jgi:hypothetical protein
LTVLKQKKRLSVLFGDIYSKIITKEQKVFELRP